MKDRSRFLRIVSLPVCFILLLSLAGCQEQKPFGLNTASDVERILLRNSDAEPDNFQHPESVAKMIRTPLEDGQCVRIVSMLPLLSLRHSDPVGTPLDPPGEAEPWSSTVLRI